MKAQSRAYEHVAEAPVRREGPTPAPQSDHQKLFALINGYRVSQMLAVAAKLRIADHLKASPRSAAELARATGAHEDSLYRLLRTLAGFDVFSEGPGNVFSLTPLATLLLSETEDSLRLDAEVVAEEWSWQAWGRLLDSVRTGRTAFDSVYGQNTWEWFQEHASASGLFNDWLQGISRRVAGRLLDAIDVTPSSVLVDVGGGHGAMLKALLRRHGSVQGILFDTPHVVASARMKWESDTSSRVTFVAGDCFDRVPGGGDVYLLKDVLHDWTDADALAILQSCRRAMEPNARLLVIEQVLAEPNQPCAGKVLDMQMMVRQGGRNRTEKEFRTLLSASDFKMTRLIATPNAPHVVVATP